MLPFAGIIKLTTLEPILMLQGLPKNKQTSANRANGGGSILTHLHLCCKILFCNQIFSIFYHKLYVFSMNARQIFPYLTPHPTHIAYLMCPSIKVNEKALMSLSVGAGVHVWESSQPSGWNKSKGKWPLPVGSRAQESWFGTRWAVDPFYYNRIMSGMDGWAMTSISTYLCVHLEIGWDVIKMLYDLCFQFYWSSCMNDYWSLIVKCISHMTIHTLFMSIIISLRYCEWQPCILSLHTRTHISHAGFRIGWAS